MIQPDVAARIDLNTVPILGLAWPVFWYAGIGYLQVAEDDVARAFDRKSAADEMRGRAYTYDGLVARDRNLEALRVGHNLSFDSDDQRLFSTGIFN